MILDVFNVFAVVVDLTCAMMILHVCIRQTLVLYCGYVVALRVFVNDFGCL